MPGDFIPRAFVFNYLTIIIKVNKFIYLIDLSIKTFLNETIELQ
jgi:hypothetical protein